MKGIKITPRNYPHAVFAGDVNIITDQVKAYMYTNFGLMFYSDYTFEAIEDCLNEENIPFTWL